MWRRGEFSTGTKVSGRKRTHLLVVNRLLPLVCLIPLLDHLLINPGNAITARPFLSTKLLIFSDSGKRDNKSGSGSEGQRRYTGRQARVGGRGSCRLEEEEGGGEGEKEEQGQCCGFHEDRRDGQLTLLPTSSAPQQCRRRRLRQRAKRPPRPLRTDRRHPQTARRLLTVDPRCCRQCD